MARLNLIQQLRCQNQISLNNFKFKEQFSLYLNSLIGSLTSTLKGAFGGILKQLQGLKLPSIDLKGAFNQLKDSVETAYKTAVSAAEEQIKSGISELTCPDAQSDLTKPTVNVRAAAASQPLSNDIKTTQSSKASEDVKNIADSKTKTLTDTAIVATDIHNKLSQEGPLEIREEIRLIKGINPLLDEYIGVLKYGQPISEDVGASFLAYTIDKPTLQLKYWSNTSDSDTPSYVPQAIRKNILLKIRSEISTLIQKSYEALNINLSKNISDEFYLERNSPPYGSSHAYHIAGDQQWYDDHALILQSQILTILQQSRPDFKDTINMVNYLIPIQEKLTIKNDTYDIDVEGKTVSIDKRNNIVQSPSTKINNSALQPKRELEV